MNTPVRRFVTSVLAVAVMVAACLCTCASVHNADVGTPTAAAIPVTPGDSSRSDPSCCHKTHNARPGEQHSQPAGPAESDPCGHCGLKNDAPGSRPDRQVVPTGGSDDLVAWSVMLPHAEAASDRPMSGVCRSTPDDIPRPPLLRDLIHTHCQLTA